MRYCLFALLLLSITSAAYVYGDVYSAEGMQKLDGAVIKIKGDGFSYYMVAEKTNYSVQLPDGRYDITAEYYGENGNLLYSASENLYLSGEDTKLDLVLTKPAQDNLLIFGLFGVVVVGIILFALWRDARRAPLKWESKAKEEAPPKPKELDEEAKKVLETIGANEGRMTQKELKETLNYSDSKISLILAELEHEGRIKRFKRGRGNIIKKI